MITHILCLLEKEMDKLYHQYEKRTEEGLLTDQVFLNV